MPDLRERCSQALERLFNDESLEVRTEAAGCFRVISTNLEPHLELVSAFIQSPAFVEEPLLLFHTLTQSSLHLPQILLDVAERYLYQASPEVTDIRLRSAMYTREISELVMKVYAQALNRPDANAELLKRCLNLFDRLASWREYTLIEMLEVYER